MQALRERITARQRVVEAKLGRYVLQETLGRGGSGLVVAAYDPVLDRAVALKFVRADRVSDRTAARIRAEARAMAGVVHPNVARMFDIATYDLRDDPDRLPLAACLEIPDHGLVLVLERVRGRPLDEVLDASTPWSTVLEVMIPAGRALAAIHDAGFVHRDFKPSNVMLEPGVHGRVRVLDFGLCEPVPVRRQLAQPQRPSGTFPYMAPEQHLGGTADPRSDQYAFCVSLVRLLFGGFPFPTDPSRMVSAKCAGRWSVPGARRVPQRIHRILRRGLHPVPHRRHPSMSALLDELEFAQRERRPRGRMLGAAALVAISSTVFEDRSERARPADQIVERRVSDFTANPHLADPLRQHLATASQSALDGAHGDLDDDGDLGDAHVLPVVQLQHGLKVERELAERP
jgi:eukaryotic-like serine/threonine-protein kinase